MKQVVVFLLAVGLSFYLVEASKADKSSWNNVIPYKIFYKGFQSVISEGENIKMSAPCIKEILSPEFKATMFQYLDAIGKPQSGYFGGNSLWLGSYQECQTLKNSHYCIGTIKLPFSNLSYAGLGLCAPGNCNKDDMLTLFELGMKALNMSKMIYAKTITCGKRMEHNTGFKVTIALFGIVLSLVLIGTITQIVKDILSPDSSKTNGFLPVRLPNNDDESSSDNEEREDSAVKRSPSRRQRVQGVLVDILVSFSLIKNIKLVLNSDVPQGAITSLNGIRVLSMWWVILGHLESAWANTQLPLADNILYAYKVIQRFTFLPINNGFYSVDSFFLLSGLLVSYLSMRRFEKYGKLPLLQFYVHRFLRLTPVYLAVILFYTYVFPHIGDGPLWNIAVSEQFTQPCKDYWWTNLIYINNFYPTNMAKTCVGWTWYLANDMQFYVISPIFLYAMYKLKIPGAMITIGPALVASFIATGILFGYYNLTPFLLNDKSKDRANRAAEFMSKVYVKPYCRVTPYLVGLFVGYILHRNLRIRGKLKWVFGLIGWAVAITLGMMITYGTWPYYREDSLTPSKFVNVAYGTFSRYIWGVAVAWVAYACHTKLGGYINDILSWKAFIPMSRLTYNVYMIHIMVLYFFIFERSSAFHFTDVHISLYFMAVVVASYGGAFILAVTVEMPCVNLEKLVFKF